MNPDMNCSKIEIDHVIPIPTFNVSNDEKMPEAFNLIKVQPF